MADDIAGLTLPGWGAQFVASRSGYPGYVIGTTPDSAATAVWGKWFGLTSVPRGHAVIGLGLDITAVAGGPPRGHAVIGLGLDGAAVGERQALGSAEIGLGIDVEARTGIAPTGYAVIGLGLDGYGVGDAAPGGSVSLDLGIGITAVGYRPPMGISIDFGGDLPITVLGHAVSGWHRPLWGEAANLTVTAVRSDLEPGWLQVPPLGLSCRVYHDGRLLMAGFLAGVQANASGIELRIEG